MIGNPLKKDSVEFKDDGVKWWNRQINRGLSRRKREKKQWKANEEAAAPKWVDGEAQINKIGSWIKTHRASLAYKNPMPKVSAKTAAGYAPVQVPVMDENGRPKQDPQTGEVLVRPVVRAQLREKVMRDIVGAPLFGIGATISRLVRAEAIAYGILNIAYKPMFETPPERESGQRIPVGEDGVLDFSDFVSSPVDGMPMQDEQGNLIRRASVPAWEDWCIDWTSYWKVIIDPDGENDFMQHRWVAMEELRPLSEVKDDPLFDNTKDLAASGYRKEPDEDTGIEGAEPEYDDEWTGDWDDESRERDAMVRLIHIFDFVQDEYLVLADGHGEYLRKVETPPGVTHSPLVFFRSNEVTDQFYQRSPITDLVPMQGEYSTAREMQQRAMKRSTRKVIVPDSADLDQEQIDNLTSDEDMAVVRPKGPYTEGSISLLTAPPIAESIYSNIQMTARDFDEIAGQPGESRGVASSKTATQVNELGKYTGVRLDFARSQLAATIREAFKKLGDSLDANMTVERCVQLVGDDGQAWVGLVDRDMISGDFDYDVDVEEMAPVDSQMDAANKLQLMTIAGQNPWLFSNEVIARGWCSTFQIKDENFIQGIVEAAQMQIQMLMAPPQPKSPEADPPKNEADAVSQTAAGKQQLSTQGAA